MNKKCSAPGPTRKNQGNCLTDRGLFRFCAESISLAAGSPWAFALSLLIVVGWILTGPLFHYSDTWQLVINTATTIVTFLMVFLIQNTQNRDTKAIQLKLDELLRGVRGARTSLVDLEHLSDEELDNLQHEFERLRAQASPNSAKANPGGPNLGGSPNGVKQSRK
jgi:low affinity Fe/Cu permease